MASEDSLETGERRPLMPLSINHSEEEKKVHDGPWPHRRTGNWKARAIILGFNCLDSISINGVGANLVVYLSTVLHQNNVASAANVATWSGTCFLTPLFGAVMADTYWGNYKTILISLTVYLLGMITITSSAISATSWFYRCHGESCQSTSGTIFFVGLYLVAAGSGGVKASLLPLGAEQFDDDNPVEREKKGAFFGWFYLCITLGALTSGTLIVWIQQNVDWGLGYGIASFCIATALAAFVLGTPYYWTRMPKGSPLKSILQVFVAAYRNKNLETPQDANLLYDMNKDSSDMGQQRLAHTDEFSFLDKAATISALRNKDGFLKSSWSLCTVTQVEELKIFLRLLPIWATSVVSAAALAQMSTTFIQQGSVMNGTIGSFSIPPATMCSFEVLSVMVWIFLYNNIIGPASKRYFGNGAGLSLLQRLGIGRFLMILAMATASYNETRRLASARAGEVISIGWQLPQFFILAIARVFSNIPQLEFFFGQAPDRMKSICTALILLAMAMGNYLNSFIITCVAVLTSSGGDPGWIPDDLNKGHLNYYFAVLAGICALNFFVYLAIARNYTLKRKASTAS